LPANDAMVAGQLLFDSLIYRWIETAALNEISLTLLRELELFSCEASSIHDPAPSIEPADYGVFRMQVTAS
jgi:hypothetical protein